jgi:hypothetical protein
MKSSEDVEDLSNHFFDYVVPENSGFNVLFCTLILKFRRA